MIKGSVGYRRRYFIKSTFQLKMILQFIFILVLAGFILGFELYIFTSNELDTKLFNAHMRIINTWDILLPTIILTLISVFILVSLITVYTVIYLSHKIAGPLYKFEKVSEEIGKGNFKVNAKLRKKDELLPLQYAFENMIENLQGKIMNFKRNYENLRKMEKKLKNAIQTSSLSETDKTTITTKVRELITDYEENINLFTFKDFIKDKPSGPYICPVHKWIGKCPSYSEGHESESKKQEIT